MRQARCDRLGQRWFGQLARRRLRGLRLDCGNAGLLSESLRLRLERLEDRLYPGDTLLGLCALGLWGTCLASDAVSSAAENGAGWHRGLGSSLDGVVSYTTFGVLEDGVGEGERGGTAGDDTLGGATFATTGAADNPAFAEDDLARQAIFQGIGVASVPGAQGQPVDLMGMLAGPGMLWPGVQQEAFFAAALAGNGEHAGGSLGVLAAAHGSSVPLAFDAASGQLGIREDAGVHTVGEAVSSGGFVDVTLDGQDHSSNPASASFDRALAGATSATVSSIRFDGGAEDTLNVGSQHVAGGFTVQASGGTVVTQNVAASGPLAIQAPSITVSGALQGSSVGLAASGWVNIEAAGRIDAVPSSGRTGSVSTPSTIAVTAGVFVNSGQLHADGATGGHINVQAGNVLNAGPITADSTGPGANGGQVYIGFTGAYVATTAAVLSASSAAGPGGQLTIEGGSTGHLFSSGRHVATGSVGGAVALFGRDVVLDGATVDTSGTIGGGLVRIGGDVQGSNSAVGNAQTVTVTSASTIRADAQQSGNGGRVSIWADQSTAFDGLVSARGGSAGGAGGLIDVSGQGNLNYAGSADAGARLGKSGTLLLDPKNLTISAAPAGVFPQFDLIDPHPTTGGTFGSQVSVLSNGNIVVANPNDNFGGSGAGAVYLFDGLSGALISSLVGSNPGDTVGSGFPSSGPGNPSVPGVTPLSNGNYVVDSPNWNGQRGAVTWGSGSTGVSGTVSATNSLVGSNPGDYVGGNNPNAGVEGGGVIPLSNGNYVIDSPNWNGNRGAVTWGNGSTGVSGTISAANSLIGSNPGDGVGDTTPNTPGSAVTPLSNGNYVVDSPSWNGGLGAVTWGNGNTGISGTVSAANSLVGSDPGVYVGYQGVTPLSNGNYVVDSSQWNGNRGAVTWGDGSTGVSGTISAANSLVGSNPGDYVGLDGVTPLSNGNYVVVKWVRRSRGGDLGQRQHRGQWHHHGCQ